MTMPEKSRRALASSRQNSAESLRMFEAAQQAIEDTRKLLEEMAYNQRRAQGDPE